MTATNSFLESKGAVWWGPGEGLGHIEWMKKTKGEKSAPKKAPEKILYKNTGRKAKKDVLHKNKSKTNGAINQKKTLNFWIQP